MQYVLPRGYLSASSIKTLQTCPKQYEFRYIEGIIIPPNAALGIGSSVHKTLETYYSDAMTSATRLTPKQAGELSGDTLEDWSKENENTMTDDEKSEAHKLLPSMVMTYVENIGQHLTPTATETECRYTMPSGVPMLGYIDLMYENNDTGEVSIADYKVTGKKLSINDLKNSLQFNLYALMTGIGDIQIHNLVKTNYKPSPKPSDIEGVTDYASNLRTIQNNFDGSQEEHFNTLVENAARLITSGIFMPCAPDAWCCNDNWCGYWKLCRGKNSA